MGAIAETLFGGITIGSAYIIVALGLAIVYGVSDVMNFSHGSLIMLSAYVAWFLSSTVLAGLPLPVLFIVVPPIMFGVGMLIERGILRPLRRQPNWATTAIVVTLGFALVINNSLLVIFGPLGRYIPPMLEQVITIGGFTTTGNRILIMGVAAALVVGLVFFLKKTRLGLSMRAVPQDIVGANIVGIPSDRIFNITFGLSAALAAIGGIFMGSIYLLAPEGGWTLFIRAFVIVLLAGAGSITGVVVASFILGILESIVQWQFGSLWIMPFWFVAFLTIMSVRPRGLFGIR